MPHVIDHPYARKSPQAYNFTKEWKQTSDLEKVSRRMKKWADLKRKPLEFQDDDQVLIKLRLEQFQFHGNRD